MLEKIVIAGLKKLIRHGQLKMILPSGEVVLVGDPASQTAVTLRLLDKNLLTKLAMNFTLALGEGYMDDRIKIEQGNLYDLIELFAINYRDAPLMPWDFAEKFFTPILHAIQQHNPMSRAKQNVAHHYDLSGQFYKLFLDKDMQYSCAYFRTPNESLETAQQNKKHHIAQKLLLQPGMRVLDIGCGWGGMALYLAENYGVHVTGVTLSEEQHRIACERAAAAGMADKVEFHLRDYRTDNGQYDRIVSVGMFEHVGTGHYKEFFQQCQNLLKANGVMLLHSIGRVDGPGTTDDWLRKYIFPGGYAPALSEVLPVLESRGLWVTDIEVLRIHYAETLRHWRERFNAHRDEIRAIYDERFCRMWEFFLIGSEMEFRHLGIMVFQLQISKDIGSVPLTRDYMYHT